MARRPNRHHHVDLTGQGQVAERWTFGPPAAARLKRKDLLARGYPLNQITVYSCPGSAARCPLKPLPESASLPGA